MSVDNLDNDDDVALLICDVQGAFMNERTAQLPGKIEGLARHYGTVLATYLWLPERSMFRSRLGMGENLEILDEGTRLMISPPAHTVVFGKHTHTAITEGVRAKLSIDGIQRVVVAGVNTEMGVMASCLDLFDLGYEVHIAEAYCGSAFGDGIHRRALDLIRAQVGDPDPELIRDPVEIDLTDAGLPS